jgi:hypothetical protein
MATQPKNKLPSVNKLGMFFFITRAKIQKVADEKDWETPRVR